MKLRANIFVFDSFELICTYIGTIVKPFIVYRFSHLLGKTDCVRNKDLTRSNIKMLLLVVYHHWIIRALVRMTSLDDRIMTNR